MSKLKLGASAPVLAAGAIALGLVAPSAASAHTAKVSKATVASDVKSAKSALTGVKHSAKSSKAAHKAISALNADVKKAAGDAFTLTEANAGQGATALCQVASLLGSEASTYTSMLTGGSGAISSTIASAITPALNGESYLLALCNDLTSMVPSSSATAGLSSASTALSGVAAELNQLSSLLSSGDLSSTIQGLLSTALSDGSSSADTIIAQLEKMIPDLPAADQAQATALLNQLQSAFSDTSGALSSASSAISTVVPTIASELNLASSWLNTLMGAVTSMMPTSGTSTSGTSTTSTTSIAPPAGLSTLLNQLGFGSIFSLLDPSSASSTGGGSTTATSTATSTSATGPLSGLFGGLFGAKGGIFSLFGGLF